MKKLLLLLFIFLPAMTSAQSWSGQSTSNARVVPPYRFCVGSDNGQDVCMQLTSANVMKVLNGSLDFALVPVTVASLPSAASNAGRVYRVTDGTSSSDCTVGGSSTTAVCISNGTSWVSLGGAAGNVCTSTPYSIQINQSSAFGCSNITVDANRSSPYIPGPTPWIDLQAPPYYARPLNSSSNPSTTGTSSGTSLTVALATGWQKNDGLVISAAGNATSQSTPAAPTITNLAANGSSSISYYCVGEDSLEGLTAASPAGTTSTAPAVFGNQPNVITAISRSSNTVSATVSGTLPYSSGNYHAVVMNVTWPSGVVDGIEYITITSSNTFTYSQTGTDESGTLHSPVSAVRLFNGFIITSAVRTGRQIVYTTDVNHNITVGPNAYYPTTIDVWGITPQDMDGIFTVAYVGANTITVETGQSYGSQTETGSALVGSTKNGSNNWNQMGLFVWESSLVTCPAVSGTTQKYYIYANYGAGSALIGSTSNGSNVFQDWGPFLTGTFTPPPAAAVPSTPPASAQNQEYVGTITNIAGTTFTVTPTIPTAVSGAAVLHDQSLAIQAADNVACTADGGEVYFSGPSNLPSVVQGYVINAPFNLFTVSQCRDLKWSGGAPLTVNDTITDNIYGSFILDRSAGVYGGSANQDSYWGIAGSGNPLINALYVGGGYAGGYSIFSNHVGFYADNGDIGVQVGGQYSRFENSYINSPNTSTALNLAQCGFTCSIHNIVMAGYPSFVFSWSYSGGDVPDGQPPLGPLIPSIAVNDASLLMDGSNSGQGKGIEFFTTNTAVLSFGSTIENDYTQQAPYTPIVWAYGQVTISSITIKNVIQDSLAAPVYGCFGCAVGTLTLDGVVGSGGALVTGDLTRGLTLTNEYIEGGSATIGQNIQMARRNAPFSVNAGPYGTASTGEDQQKRPFMFPYLNNYPLFWEQQTSGVTAVTSGVGTIPAGSHTFCILPVGWNGGDGGFGQTSCATVSVNGSQGVLVSWTATSGVQGYDLYSDFNRQNSSIISAATTSTTVSGALGGYGSAPFLPGSGLPLIDQNQVATPLLRANSWIPLLLYSAAGTALPTCNSAAKGEKAVVSDATSPTYMGAYSSGGGVTTSVICSYNGSSYAWLTD